MATTITLRQLHARAYPQQVQARPVYERAAFGAALRRRCPREAQAQWRRHAGRIDPIAVLVASNKGRLPELIPLRYGRMMVSPFTFYRGAAAILAADLAHTPATGVALQACGDCHLLNFGLARAHARSGDAVVLSADMGKAEGFEDALSAFAVAYAEQNERDYAKLMAAIRAGRIQAENGHNSAWRGG